MDKINLSPNWKIKLKIFKKIELSKKSSINKIKSKLLKTYSLNPKKINSTNLPLLECYLEYDLFKSLLTGKFPWNTSLSGSTVMFKRYPNTFHPNMVFSLNFLRI